MPINTGKITDVETDNGYKYLVDLQSNVNMQNKIKKYIKIIKQVLE